MVVGRAQHLAQAATSTGQGLELEIGRAVGLLALLLQPPECVPEAGEPGSVDGSLDQQVSVREEELTLRLAQKPRPVTEDLLGSHGSVLCTKVGSASRFDEPGTGATCGSPVGGPAPSSSWVSSPMIGGLKKDR